MYAYLNHEGFVWKERFAIVKSKKPISSAFAVIQDKCDITVVIDQEKIDAEDVIEMSQNWKILTFDMVLPLTLIGFLAKISTALANEKISIFTLSAFSTDHILVKEEDLSPTLKKLETLGFLFRYLT